ncbi:MAG: hypothetical protein OIF56_10795 [Cohaesibacter sp.]|nr:hypothetical protein [Cohaesibacter sp.]
MSYGFNKSEHSPDPAITLPAPKKEKPDSRQAVSKALDAGKKLGFVSRQTQTRRKPGPRRTEAQGKLTLTGPQRVIERLQAYADSLGGVPYWQAVEKLLDEQERL